MSSLYTKYHIILKGRSIPAMITIYTDNGTTPMNVVRKSVKGTNESSHAACHTRIKRGSPIVDPTVEVQSRKTELVLILI